MKLLLVDSRLKDISIIINSLQIDTKYVVIDYLNDTFEDIVNNVSALNETSFSSIGYMAHGEYKSYYKMLNKQNTYSRLKGINNIDANMDTWIEIINLWTSLINTYNVSFVDYLGCCLIDKSEWVYIFNKFNSIKQGTIFRGSSNQTGNTNNGDWILETDGTNVKDLYFTDSILNYEYNLYLYIFGTKGRSPLKTLPGSVITWGDYWGVDTDNVSSSLSSDVISVYTVINDTKVGGSAYAALKMNGSVVTWGYLNIGGNSLGVSNNLNSDVTSIYSTYGAFAALKNNGSVVTWGLGTAINNNFGGNSMSVTSNLTSGVVSIYSTERGFAALKNNGSVVAWGSHIYGGNVNINDLGTSANLTSNVVSIYSTNYAFAALKNDGSVVAWGDASGGGSLEVPMNATYYLNSNVAKIYSNDQAFAAIKNDGSVVTWGQPSYGGNVNINDLGTSANLTSNVVSIYSTKYAFAALKDDGSVVAWGPPLDGGDIYYTPKDVSGNLSSNVVSIYSTSTAFAAIKNDGSVVTWGGEFAGGETTNYIWGGPDVTNQLTGNVVSIFSTEGSFAALKDDGSVVTWGDELYGGNSSSVANSLNSNVVFIYSTATSFSAIKNDGSVVSWGNVSTGGDYTNSFLDGPDVTNELNGNIVSIYSSYDAFAAIKTPSTSVSISGYSDKHKIDVLKTRGRYNVSNTSLTITGDTSISPNLKNGVTYNLIKNTGNNIDLSGNSYIAVNDGEPVVIGNITYINYEDRIYYLNNGLWTRISNPIIINNRSYNFYEGSIIAELINSLSITYTSKTSSSITFSLSGTDNTGLSATHIVYIASGNDNISTIAGGTSVLLTSLTNNGNGSYTLTGLNPSTEYSIISKTSNNNSTNRVRETTSAAPGGGGDPHIETINGVKYNLPNDENCYLLFDNNNPNDRVRITTKSWFLPNNRMYNFWNNYMEDTSFFRYVNVQHNNDNLTIDLENLNIVEYNERNINNYTLKQTTNKTTIRISDKYEDKNILSRHYGDYKRNLYKIKFNGVSRKINVLTDISNYEIRVSCDLNCADERNEVCLIGGSFEGCTGAFISESQAVMIPSLI